MKWWEIPQNCNCLFALDSESILEEDNSKVYYSSDTLKFLRTYRSLKNKVSKGQTHGFASKSFENIFETLYSYDCLYLDNTNLEFNTRFYTGDECTWILKCEVLDPTVMSQGSSTASNGLTFTNTSLSETTGKTWYAGGLNSKTPILNKNRRLRPNTIHNVIIRNNNFLKTTSLKTDSKLDTVPESTYFTTGFGSNHEVVRIGYSVAAWYPKVKIIAYGAFDKILTKEEEDKIFAQIDVQFLRNVTQTQFKTTKPVLDNRNTFNFYTKINPLNIVENIQSSTPIEAIFNIKKDSAVFDRDFSNKLHKKSVKIKDIVLEENVPIQAKLYLYERESGVLIKTTYSDKKGVFEFNNLDPEMEYRVTSNDPKYQFQTITKNYRELL